MAKKEYKIGEIINHRHIKLKVVEANHGLCEGCFFLYKEERICTDLNNEAGRCSHIVREDDTDVIFEKVGEY